MIRQATIDDLPAIKRCVKDAYEIYISRIGHEPKPMQGDYEGQIGEGIVHVSVGDDGDVQGYIVFYGRDNETLLENVAVSPLHQGKGVGKALIAYCEAEARRRGSGAITLFTHRDMTENQVLYRRLGYAQIDREDDAKLNRVFFRKPLP